LDGRDPLGFLAALGVLRLLSEELSEEVRLSFSDRSATALLHGPVVSLDEVTDLLRTVAGRTPADGVCPDATVTFPLKAGKGSDPMRVPRAELRALHRQFPGTVERRWLSVLLTDLAVDKDGRVLQTPFTAPSGKQNLRTFFEKTTAAVRSSPERFTEALTGWRRVSGFTGEYLDHRVLQSTADHPGGEKGQEAGVPGATWLAIMALPLFRLTGDGRGSVAATLWRRVPGRRQPAMVWPLWRQPLDLDAVRVLLEHPGVRLEGRDGGQLAVRRSRVAGLGVFLVAAAERQRIEGRNFAGVLAPLPVTLEPD
jgi:hypothetical protein